MTTTRKTIANSTLADARVITPPDTVAPKEPSQPTHKKMGPYQIPRESFLREQIAQFNREVNCGYEFELYGHEGLKSQEEKAKFAEIKKEIQTLTYFAESETRMFHWHHRSMLNNVSHLSRYFAVRINNETVGAIQITITLDESQLKINYLSIRENAQNKSLGTLLLLVTIVAALQYRCKKVVLTPVHHAKKFYQDRGFQPTTLGTYELNLTDPIVQNKIIEIFKKIAPNFNIKSLLASIPIDTNPDHSKFPGIMTLIQGRINHPDNPDSAAILNSLIESALKNHDYKTLRFFAKHLNIKNHNKLPNQAPSNYERHG